MPPAEREMLLGQAEVARRINVGANIRYLTQAELTSVLNAETYRYRGLVENSGKQPCQRQCSAKTHHDGCHGKVPLTRRSVRIAVI